MRSDITVFSVRIARLFRQAAFQFSWILVSFAAVTAQYYPEYESEPSGPPLLERILTNPFVTLLVVLVGSAGVFNYFFSTGRGERSDKQSLVAIVCFVLVILLVWYRFSLWADKGAH